MNLSQGSIASSLWTQGWYRYAKRLDSPNFGARPPCTLVDLVVVHSISLPPGEYVGDKVQQLFTNQLDWDAHPYFDTVRGLQVSAHFYVRRNGELWQFVSCNDRAWHAGESYYRGRGDCNDNSVGIELEGLEGQSFEAMQYETLSSICAALPQCYPIEHFAGHEHIAPGRKDDPGPGFDWALLTRTLAYSLSYFPRILQSGHAEPAA